MKKVQLELTLKEAEMAANLILFVDAGEVSGGPYDDQDKRKLAANVRVSASLQDKLWGAIILARKGAKR